MADQARAADIVATLCLATDLGMGFPLEHGLHSTVVAMRIAERLGVDQETAVQTYYGCLLCYVGCTADAEISAELFEEGALLAYFTPAVFGSPGEILRGVARALVSPETPAPARAVKLATWFPRATRGHRAHIDAMCEVAGMLGERLGMPAPVRLLTAGVAERWDGKGQPAHLKAEELPLALRIVHVARDMTFQRLLWGEEETAEIIRRRGGGAFDPTIAALAANELAELTAQPGSCWTEVMDREPGDPLMLVGDDIDRALGAVADFSDLVSPYLVGHSSGVARLAEAAGRVKGLPGEQLTALRRAGLVHDVGRVGVAARIWAAPGPLSADDWEKVRLHPYYTERVLGRSPFLSGLKGVAALHHERLDGSGYHRGSNAAELPQAARMMAAADAFRCKTEARAYREPFTPTAAADAVLAESRAGRLDPECVAAVIGAAGLPQPTVAHPAGLTEREVEVVRMLAHGLQTKQVARALGIATKTADRHVQNANAKMGVSTRAAAAVFAMQHGLTDWGELPMGTGAPRS